MKEKPGIRMSKLYYLYYTLGCDQVFWVGDLNYRLNELDASDVKTSPLSGKYQQLFLYDQLNIERRKRRCVKLVQPHFLP